jgi:glyoxylase-like metal-dependent hydrolase (beta-lactamase superfamily II)
LEIITGIYRIDEASNNIAHSNIYLVINGSELIIIDTGTPGNAEKIIEYIKKIGRQPNEVSTIILTHYHIDHVGSAKGLKELTAAKVAASVEDGEVVNGKRPYPKPKNLLLRVASSFMKIEPVNVDIELKDGDMVGNLRVINAPGHTPGSIFLYDSNKKVLFSGDTLRLESTKVVAGPKQYVWDEKKERQSIKNLESIEVNVLLPGHGEYLKNNASAAIKELIAQWK